MFGGHGFYVDGLFVAIIAWEELYLKVDDITKAAFDADSCAPFVYSNDREGVFCYHMSSFFAEYSHIPMKRLGRLPHLRSRCSI
jgi:DNA transformation protein and related proteins